MIIAGICADHLGLSSQGHRHFQLPAHDIAPEHPTPVFVDVNHDGPAVGVARHLQRDGRGSLWALAEIDPDVDVERLCHFSPSLHRDHAGEPWTIHRLSLTDVPAQTALGRVHVLEDAGHLGQITAELLSRTRRSDPYLATLLQRAADTARARRSDSDPLVVTDPAHDQPRHAPWVGSAMPRTRALPYWVRSGDTIISVK